MEHKTRFFIYNKQKMEISKYLSFNMVKNIGLKKNILKSLVNILEFLTVLNVKYVRGAEIIYLYDGRLNHVYVQSY